MKIKLFTKLILLIIFCLSLTAFSPVKVFASSLSLSPGSGNIPVGGKLSVTINLNTGGEGVNAATAVLAYPADLLDVTGVGGSSAFGIEAERSSGGGIVKISKGSINPLSGRLRIATVTFRGKKEGTATVAFIGGSAAPRATDSSDSLNLGGSSGGVFKVVKGSVAQPGDKKEGTKAAQPGSQAVVAEIQVSGLKVQSIATDSASIIWKTDRLSQSVVEVGLEPNRYFFTASNGNLTLDHEVTLSKNLLIPGTLLHYRIKSIDEAGNEVLGADNILQVPGYKVVVKVVDEKGQPIPGVEVMLFSEPKKAVTNQAGEAVFIDVTAGKHTVSVTSALTSATQEIDVKGDSVDLSSGQQVQLQVNRSVLSVAKIYYKELAGLVVGVLFITILLTLLFTGRIPLGKLFRKKQVPQNQAPTIVNNNNGRNASVTNNPAGQETQPVNNGLENGV